MQQQEGVPASTTALPPPDSTERRGGGAGHVRLAFGVFAAIVLLLAISLGATRLSFGSRLFWPPLVDDAYYYYTVAYNVTHGHGLTHDGIHTTTGFHPLWFLVILPIFAVAERGSENAVIAVQCLSIVAYAATIACLVRLLLAMHVCRQIAICVAVAALFAPFISHTAGMEAVLVLPIQVALLVTFGRMPNCSGWRPRSPTSLQILGGGALLGLLVLARLDCVFMCISVLGFASIATLLGVRRRAFTLAGGAARLCMLGAGSALLVGAYVFWNWKTTGHLVPISGALKSTFPTPGLRTRWLEEFPHWFALTLPMAGWLIVQTLRHRQIAGWPGFSTALGALVIGALCHASYTLFFCKWAVHGWHFASYIIPALVCCALLLSDFVAGLGQHRRRIVLGTALGAVALVGLGSVAFSIRKVMSENEFGAAAFDAARWAENNSESGVRFAMSDCGVFGYYSRRQCVNLDGVINSWEFQQVLASGKLDDHLRELGVEYLVSHWVPQSLAEYETLERPFPARSSADGKSVLHVERCQEVFRSAKYNANGGEGFLAIWRLRH